MNLKTKQQLKWALLLDKWNKQYENFLISNKSRFADIIAYIGFR